MGTVYLIGAGPGAPDLVTLRGWRLLRRAEAVLHDALVDPDLLRLPPPSAHIVDVGRRAGQRRRLDQAGINDLLIRLSKRHETVVRLKGGDPFVFGRGGEEGLALRAAGVPFEVVPGVTAGVGALVSAGIPLTHRGLASTATFVTARAGEGTPGARWGAIAEAGGTVIVYMGRTRVAEVCETLVRHGRAPETPAALVVSGTTPAQRVIRAPLRDLAELASGAGNGPGLIVVGATASLDVTRLPTARLVTDRAPAAAVR